MPAPKSTNKHDVALAEVARKAARETIVARGLVTVVVLAVSALPIIALRSIIEPLAGRTTNVNVSLVFSVTIAISVVLNGLQYFKGRSQRAELQRQRERLQSLGG